MGLQETRRLSVSSVEVLSARRPKRSDVERLLFHLTMRVWSQVVDYRRHSHHRNATVSPPTTAGAGDKGRHSVSVVAREVWSAERVDPSLTRYADFFPSVLPKLKLASSGFLGEHWKFCNACFFK